MSDGPEPILSEAIVEAVKYLAAAVYDAGKHGALQSSSVTDASNELGEAIGAELGRLDAEIARLNKHCDSYVEAHYKDAACIAEVTRGFQEHGVALQAATTRISELEALVRDGLLFRCVDSGEPCCDRDWNKRAQSLLNKTENTNG